MGENMEFLTVWKVSVSAETELKQAGVCSAVWGPQRERTRPVIQQRSISVSNEVMECRAAVCGSKTCKHVRNEDFSVPKLPQSLLNNMYTCLCMGIYVDV